MRDCQAVHGSPHAPACHSNRRLLLGLQCAPAPHTEKLVPQPQDAVATGLLIRKAEPIRSWTKSIPPPAMYCTETGSTSTVAPSRASTRSSSAWAVTKSNLYWNPEQPPPATLTRSIDPTGSALRIS